MRRVEKLEEFSLDQPVLTQPDRNVASKLTGYIIYRQGDRYIIGPKALANRLRAAGFVVQNTIC